MKIHEYQAASLLHRYGIETPIGQVAFSSAEVGTVVRELGAPCMLKAQVHTGGRGKAGGIRRAESPCEAEMIAGSMFGNRLITPQTGPEGKAIRCIYVTQCMEIHKEYYLSFTVDGDASQIVMLASPDGGVDIEETALSAPERIIREPIDIGIGLRPYQARGVAARFGIRPELTEDFIQIAMGLYQLFLEQDCSLLEINPLAETDDGNLTAVDAKIVLDDNALFRHEENRALRDSGEDDPKEDEASRLGVSYVSLGGDIGCLVNGAGLAMATMDIIQHFGGQPANFLDVGGSATEEKVEGAFRILLSDPKVKGLLVNIFGGIMKCDIVARGILAAVQKTGTKHPVVVRLEGTNAEVGKRLLGDSRMRIVPVSTLSEAARTVVSFSQQREGLS